MGAMENMYGFEGDVASQIDSGDTVLYQVVPLYEGHRTVPYAFQMSEVWWGEDGQLGGARATLISNNSMTPQGRKNLGTVVDTRTGMDVPTS